MVISKRLECTNDLGRRGRYGLRLLRLRLRLHFSLVQVEDEWKKIDNLTGTKRMMECDMEYLIVAAVAAVVAGVAGVAVVVVGGGNSVAASY